MGDAGMITCDDSACNSLGNDCCAPSGQTRTCSGGMLPLVLHNYCNGRLAVLYTCCTGTISPPGGREEPILRRTRVEIRGEQWMVNGRPTYQGKKWAGISLDGLLMNSRMVNAVFDDLNDATRDALWRYPDTSVWDAERNTDEFVAELSEYAARGLQAVTVSLQGGSPCGNNPSDSRGTVCELMYQRDSSAFGPDGAIRPAFFARLERILDATDRLGMVALVQLFYPDEAFKVFGDDAAILRAADNFVGWLASKRYTHVAIDVCNECDLCRISEDSCTTERLALTTLHWPGTPHVDHGALHLLLQRMRGMLAAYGLHPPLATSFLGGEVMKASELQVGSSEALHRGRF